MVSHLQAHIGNVIEVFIPPSVSFNILTLPAVNGLIAAGRAAIRRGAIADRDERRKKDMIDAKVFLFENLTNCRGVNSVNFNWGI
jgi:hypothetical protein